MLKLFRASSDPGGVVMTAPKNDSLQDLDKQILDYGRRWHQVGVFVRCTLCGEGQKASESAAAFPHFSTCTVKSTDNQYPWRELAEILSTLPNEYVIDVQTQL